MPLTNSGRDLISASLHGTAFTNYANANARIGVGDSTTAFAATQQDLVASTNVLRKVMDGGYPTLAQNVLTFRSTFTTSEANFAWNEWGVFNGSGAGGAGPSGVVMLNRKQEALGTKTSAQSWQFTVTLTVTAA